MIVDKTNRGFGLQTLTPSGTTQTIDFEGSATVAGGPVVLLDLSSASGSPVVLTISNPTKGGHYFFFIKQSSTARQLTWPATAKWPGGVTPSLPTTAASITLVTADYDGTNFYLNMVPGDGSLTLAGALAASNFSGTSSGTNTGDVTTGAFGSVPSATGISLTGQIFSLEPADGSNPGSVSITNQTFTGIKTFSSPPVMSGASISATTVAAAALAAGAAASNLGSAGGDLTGTYPSPTVAAVHETAGPTKLTLGSVPDGTFLQRSGSTLVGATPAGAGNVTGPGSSTDTAIARFNGTGGTVIENSSVTIDGSGNITPPALATYDGRDVSVDGSTLDTISPLILLNAARNLGGY